MNEQSGNKGLWVALIVFLLAALAFVVLWYLRGGEIERLDQQLRTTRDQAASASQRLERDLRQAQSEATSSSQRVSELENQIREEQRRSSESAQQLERRLRGDLDISAGRISELTGQLEQVHSEADSLRGELAAAREELSGAQASVRSGAERIAQLESDMSGAQTRLRETEQALGEAKRFVENHPEVERLSGELRTSSDALATLRKRYDELEVLLSGKTERESGFEERIAALEKERDDLTTELRAARENQSPDEQVAALNEKLTAAATSAETSTEALRQRADEVERLSAQLTEAKTAIAEKESLIGELRASVNNLGRELTGATEDLAKSEESGKRLREELDALRESHRNLADAERTLQRHLEEVTRTPEKAPAAEPEKTAAPVPAGTGDAAAPRIDVNGATIVFSPARSVGRVVEVKEDKRGRVYVIDKGRRQGVRPGMRFDVHRAGDGIYRFSGLLQVIQPMEDASLAMAIPSANTMICPITGRAYLEPGAAFSPYVVSADGGQVPLITAASVGLDKESPEPGDLVDNPFFAPGGKLDFMICADVGDESIDDAIEALGGTIHAEALPSELDYLVVGSDGAFTGSIGGPRRVTAAHVEKYIAIPIPLKK